MRFLIGPESSWITGQCISVDGGQSLRKGADFGRFAEAVYQDQPGWKLVVESGEVSERRRRRSRSITGGASGIGRSTAAGAGPPGRTDIVVADLNDTRIDEVRAEVEALGRRYLGVHCDVAKDADVESMRDAGAVGMSRRRHRHEPTPASR